MSTRALSNFEIGEILNRNPEAKARVHQHETYIQSGRVWDQIAMAMMDTLPIPVRGYAFVDSGSKGKVIIFPDAKGFLRYVLTKNDSLFRAIQQPTYQSPDGSLLATFDDFLRNFHESVQSALHQIFVGALIVGTIVGVVWAAGKGRWEWLARK